MRNAKYFMMLVVSLFVSNSSLAESVALDIVVSAHGSTCEEAKANLRDQILNGSAVYSSDQAATHQFPAGPAAIAYCQAERGSPAPFTYVPDINDNGMFALPTEVILSQNRPCSSLVTDGATVFGVGWQGSSACLE